MATNLVSLVMQFLTPDVIGRIATALGLDRNFLQSAISAAVPALLAGLSGAAEKPGGAAKLVDAIKQQTGVLDNFAKTIDNLPSLTRDPGSSRRCSVAPISQRSRVPWPNSQASVRMPAARFWARRSESG